jgi:hypothetical protein
MKERICIVGDDPVLLETRSCLLEGWEITTSTSREAEEVIKTRAYDLLIFGHTVADDTAKRLIGIANEMYPLSVSLVLRSAFGEDRDFGSATYEIDFGNPGGFRDAVERLLNSRNIAA